jgi:hypothetical protein
MPTGYTHDVAEGKVTTLRDFALRCSRAFGATITMRDDPTDAPIPERFDPSDYHQQRIAEARAELARLDSATPAEIEAMAAAEKDETEVRYAGYREKDRRTRERYDAMQSAVLGWDVPAELHELRNFMLEQIARSREFDCHDWTTPPCLLGEKWAAGKRAKLHSDIAYHKREHAKEVERVEGRNRWLAALRSALPDA